MGYINTKQGWYGRRENRQLKMQINGKERDNEY